MGKNTPTPFVNAFDHPQIASLRYNTSQAGAVLPVVFGTQRVPVNVIDYFGFRTHGGSSKGGGKGLGGATSNKKGAGGTTYSVNVAFALVQGPVSYTASPWAIGGQNRVWANGSAVAIDQIQINAYTGNDGQSPDPVFDSSSPLQPAIGYSGTAFVTGTPMQLGSSPALPNVSFEVGGFVAGDDTGVFTGDANPGHIVTELLTNSRYGAGFPAGNLDIAGSVAGYITYCRATQLVMSMILDRQQPAARWLEEICLLTVAAPVWSGSLLKIIPYADIEFTENGADWVPALVAQYSLSDSDFIDFGGETDPVVVTRKDPSEATNWLSLEYMDAFNNYNPQIIYVFDQGLIDRYGLRTKPSQQGHNFTNPTSATTSALLQMRRDAYVHNSYRFKLGFRFSRLEPMDIVAITDPYTGLAARPVRIIQIDEDDNGELTVTAEELPSNPFALPVVQSSVGQGVNFLADPGDANTPIIFEPGPELTGERTEAWLITSGGSDWGGAEVWISTDDTTYAKAGVVYAGARQGVLLADLPSHADPDSDDTLSVDLTISAGQLLSGTRADADSLVTLCYCDDELVSYQTATLTAAHEYDLTYLRRGAYGSEIAAHLAGAPFARFGPNDPQLFRYAYPASFVGQLLYVKLVSFNSFGQRLQDIATLAPVTYLLNGAGKPGPRFEASGSQSGPTLSHMIIGKLAACSNAIFPNHFAGSRAHAAAAPAADTVYNIVRNGATTVGTVSWAAGQHVASFASVDRATAFLQGHVLTLEAPASPDAAIQGIAWDLNGRQAGAVPVAEIHGGQSGPLIASLIIERWIAANPVTFPENMYKSFMVASSVGTGTATFNLCKNGVSFGTAVFVAGFTQPLFVSTETAFVPGEVFTLVAPSSPDATLQTLVWGFPLRNNISNPVAALHGSVSGPVVPNLVIFRHVFVATMVIPDGMPKSLALAEVAGIGATVFDIKLNGVTVGTMTYPAGDPTAIFAMPATTCNAGDVLTIAAPASPDGTLAGLIFAIAGDI